MKLNDNAAHNKAIELTKIALEHSYIGRGNDDKETAEKTYEYYETLRSLFTGTNQKDTQ